MTEFSTDNSGSLVSVSLSGNYRLAVGHEEMNSRRRNTMEDVHRILDTLLPNYSYFSVYDGHGGRHVVDFLEQALEQNIAKELQLPDDAGALERLSRAFLITDMQSRRLNLTTSGATAVVALIKRESDGNRKLYIANCGDSRAVLVCEKGVDDHNNMVSNEYYARRLSYDHKADDENEQKRIAEAGGFVTKNRVLGILAVSRSFGDHGMKDFVTAEPFLSETDLGSSSAGHFPMLILACDGVWDVFEDQEAADFLIGKWKENSCQPFENASKVLVNEAIARGSADNITAIVVFL